MTLMFLLTPLNNLKPGRRKRWISLRRRRRRRSRTLWLEHLAGDKCAERDPDDDATLMEIMKKKKVLEDKKKELDEQVAAALAAKKTKLQKETPPAPSESEIDLGVFSAKHGNLLEKIFAASGSQGAKSGKGTRKFDISKITPPTSPPSRTFGLSPPHPDPRGKEKKDEVEQVENVTENVVGVGGDGGGGGGRGEGADTEAESSEATPRHTIYTKCAPGSGGGGTSGVRGSPEYENVQAGSWDTHNPTCADLPPPSSMEPGSRVSDD
ncbi:hypothetical protein HanOQP8_Chr01g0016421 [Helianthus annuus]|nr:hypothetical protein HanOQP8_Chr01g0016421 [Helianthus annuus]